MPPCRPITAEEGLTLPPGHPHLSEQVLQWKSHIMSQNGVWKGWIYSPITQSQGGKTTGLLHILILVTKTLMLYLLRLILIASSPSLLNDNFSAHLHVDKGIRRLIVTDVLTDLERFIPKHFRRCSPSPVIPKKSRVKKQ